MKYTFNTLEEVKTAIEQWFIDCGYAGIERSEKQYLKIIAEVGEMADALCKEDHENFKSEAGDVFVTIVGYCLQKGRKIPSYEMIRNDFRISSLLVHLISNINDEDFHTAIEWLKDICIGQNTNILECATIAYNKIQERLENGKLKVINGTIQK